MIGFVKAFDHYHHKFNFCYFSSSPVKLLFRPKCNNGFTNHCCLHCAILKAFYNFKVQRAHEASDNQFFFPNEIFEIFKMFKTA